MGYSKKVTLLQELLNEMSDFKLLNYGNDKYEMWKAKADITLEELFNKGSIEYRMFQDTHLIIYTMPSSDKEKRDFYSYLINTYERNLKSIIERQKTKEELKKIFKLQRFFRFIKELLENVTTKTWHRIKAHKVLSIVSTALLIVITLLGTNWTTVMENVTKIIDFFR